MGAQKSALATRQRSVFQSMPQNVREMHVAVMQNDVIKLKHLLASGVDVNYPWMNPAQPSVKDGSTAIIEAISLNHVEAVKVLIEAKACASYINGQQWLVLQKAVYHGRDIIVRLLIDAGISVHVHDEDRNTPLHICTKNGFVHNKAQCIQTLLQCGAAPNAKNNKGITPLHLAATWGMTQMVSILLDWKSYIDAVDNDYLTPFYMAAACVIQRRQPPSLTREIFARQLATFKLLLHSGSDSLGFARWFRETLRISNDPDFDAWLHRKTPDDLKHLCRVYIQNLLGFTSIRHNYCVRKIRTLDIPEALKEYLCRRIIVD